MTPAEATFRVLVADSSAAFREAMAEAIGGQPGWRLVAQASSANDAFELFLRHRPEAVVVEIALPDHGGLELVRSLRQVDSRCLVILVGRQVDPFVGAVGKLMGADEVFQKSTDLQPLRAALRRSALNRVPARSQVTF